MPFDDSPSPSRPGRTSPVIRLAVAGLLAFGLVAASRSTLPVPPVVVTVAAQEPGAELQAGHAEVDMAEGAEEHAEGILPTIARLLNFAILAGVLIYFLRTPLQAYLASRSGQIRQDLITAAETRAAASAQLVAIQEKLNGLPAELDALRTRGAEDVRLERERIAQAATAERERLLEHTRREVERRLHVAHRELVEQAATLAVDVAQRRIERTMTPEDQLRLVDRYAGQLQEAR